jgi:hypothetical protein
MNDAAGVLTSSIAARAASGEVLSAWIASWAVLRCVVSACLCVDESVRFASPSSGESLRRELGHTSVSPAFWVWAEGRAMFPNVWNSALVSLGKHGRLT